MYIVGGSEQKITEVGERYLLLNPPCFHLALFVRAHDIISGIFSKHSNNQPSNAFLPDIILHNLLTKAVTFTTPPKTGSSNFLLTS